MKFSTKLKLLKLKITKPLREYNFNKDLQNEIYYRYYVADIREIECQTCNYIWGESKIFTSFKEYVDHLTNVHTTINSDVLLLTKELYLLFVKEEVYFNKIMARFQK